MAGHRRRRLHDVARRRGRDGHVRPEIRCGRSDDRRGVHRTRRCGPRGARGTERFRARLARETRSPNREDGTRRRDGRRRGHGERRSVECARGLRRGQRLRLGDDGAGIGRSKRRGRGRHRLRGGHGRRSRDRRSRLRIGRGRSRDRLWISRLRLDRRRFDGPRFDRRRFDGLRFDGLRFDRHRLRRLRVGRRRGRRRVARRRRRRRRVGRRGRWGGGTRRQQRGRVDVPLRLGGEPDPDVHVRAAHLGVARGADRPDDVAFGDRGALRDRGRAEVRERDRVAVGGRDRERAPRARDGADVGHLPRRGRAHGTARVACEVEPAVLAAGVRVVRVERVGLEHGAVRRPGPGAGERGYERSGEQRGKGRDEEETTHGRPPCCPGRERVFPR